MQGYDELSICKLCVTSSGKLDVAYFNLDDKFYEMVSKITEIKSSRIFHQSWTKCGEEIKEVVTMEIIFSRVWSRTREKLKSISQHFLEGSMQLKKIDKYLNMFENDYDALKEEFMLLSKHFIGTTPLDQIKKKLRSRIKHVKRYKKLFDARQAARAILDLQKALDLKGNFSEVESIEKVDYHDFFSSKQSTIRSQNYNST